MCVFIFIITYNYRDHCTHKNGISNCCYCYQSSLPSSGSGKWSDHRASLDVDEYLTGIIIIIINYYYSLKIFPRFWLAKGTRIIHHNQLLMTKFGKILCLTRKQRSKCSPLQVKALLPRRPGEEVELFWLWKKNGRHFTRFKSKNYSWN